MRISDWSSDVCSSDLVENLAAAGAAMIDQHQRMLLGNGGITAAIAFQSAVFDQPGSRYFAHAIVTGAEQWQPWPAFGQSLGIVQVQHRVLEKAAGIADQHRIG